MTLAPRFPVSLYALQLTSRLTFVRYLPWPSSAHACTQEKLVQHPGRRSHRALAGSHSLALWRSEEDFMQNQFIPFSAYMRDTNVQPAYVSPPARLLQSHRMAFE